MSLLTGRIEQIYAESGLLMGKVNVRGAFIRVPLTFVSDARIGDIVVIESGVAVARTDRDPASEI
jgi:hydrogenase maturation factor